MIVLVLGGSRSGKSDLAERIALEGSGPWTYLATARVTDPDMGARVAAHRSSRDTRWETVETGADLPASLASVDSGTALVDSLGTWVAAFDDLDPPVDALVDAISRASADGVDVVLVSDEVGMGVHPATPVGRRFRDVLGSLNRAVSEVADQAALVVAGRVVRLATADDWHPLADGGR